MSTINLQEVLIVNGIGIALMIFLIRMRSQNIQRKSEREYIFDAMIGLTILGNLAEIITTVVDGRIFPGSFVLSYFFNTVCYLTSCCVGFLWCLYVDLRIFNSRYRIRKKIWYLAIPFLIDVALCLINLTGCGFMFTISDQNIYQRGTLSWAAYVILFFYFIYSICLADRSRKSGLYIQRFPTYYYVVPCILGTVVQGLCYGITLGYAAVAMALVFVYIQLQSMDSLADPLSGLYNRRYLDNILEHMRRNPKRPVFGVMMDVDDFKKINDNHGHSVGDDTIRAIGQILADSIPACGIAIRYAGDEFILLLSTDSEDIVLKTIQRINENVEKYNASRKEHFPLSLSIGYDRFDTESGDTEAFLQAMDKKMYVEKEKYHGQTN